MNKRNHYSAEFKTKVVLEILSEESTINQIAAQYGISPVVLSRWKKEFLERASEVFKKGPSETEKELTNSKEHIAELERKVGQLSYEVDWLKKKYENKKEALLMKRKTCFSLLLCIILISSLLLGGCNNPDEAPAAGAPATEAPAAVAPDPGPPDPEPPDTEVPDPGAPAFEIPAAQATKASPPVVVVSGTNDEMGYQYALQAGDLIYRNINMLKSKAIDQLGEELFASDMEVWSYYADQYDPGLRPWLEGMQAGLKDMGYDVSYNDLIIATVFPAAMWCRPDLSTPYPEETGVVLPQPAADDIERGEIHGCTAFAAEGDATADGKPIVAITEMVPKERLNVIILIAFPDDGLSYVAKACAGSVAGNGGMNSEGFSWVLTAQWGEPIWGVATEVFFHYLSQYCHTSADAIKLLQESPRAGVTGAFLISDSVGNVQAFESLSNDYAIRVPGDDGETADFLIQTNHLIAPSMQKYNPPDEVNYTSINRYITMFDHVRNAAAKNSVSVETAKLGFGSDDWLDSHTNEWVYNDPGSPSVNNNTGSVAQVVFHPADTIAYFQIGTPGGAGLPAGSTGEYFKIELGDDPFAVTNSADTAATDYYWAARNLYQKMLNEGYEKLSYEASVSIRELLDTAALELEYGMDRMGFAYFAADNGLSVEEEMQLWSDALSHYVKCQLYSQMVSTRLESLS